MSSYWAALSGIVLKLSDEEFEDMLLVYLRKTYKKDATATDVADYQELISDYGERESYFLTATKKNDIINEKLEEKMEIKKYILPLVVIGGYTITTGIAAGFCNTNPLNLGILVVVVTWVASYAGMYTGYRAGFEQKTKAYIAGGALLIIVGIDMAVRCFVLGQKLKNKLNKKTESGMKTDFQKKSIKIVLCWKSEALFFVLCQEWG